MLGSLITHPLRMQWDLLLFLHWEYPAKALQDKLPEGLTLDTYDGKAYLAVVPFIMRQVRPSFFFPVPWLSNFEELNVRTYVRGKDGLSGVWFFSLACNQPLAVELARKLYNLNYCHAKMKVRKHESTVHYECQRAPSDNAQFSYPCPPQDVSTAKNGSLEEFLLERYVLFSANKRGQLYAGRVFHQPYQFCALDSVEHSFLPATIDGFQDPNRPADLIHAARRVDVKASAINRYQPTSPQA